MIVAMRAMTWPLLARVQLAGPDAFESECCGSHTAPPIASPTASTGPLTSAPRAFNVWSEILSTFQDFVGAPTLGLRVANLGRRDVCFSKCFCIIITPLGSPVAASLAPRPVLSILP